MGIGVSSSHVVSATPSSSRGGLLTLFLCSSVRSLLQETARRELLQCESFPQATALHDLVQHGSLPQGAVLREQTATAWVPCGVTSPARKPAPAWASTSLVHRVHRSWQENLIQNGLATGSQPLGASTCSTLESSMAAGGCLFHHEPPWAAGGQAASPWSSQWAAGESLLWHLEHLLPLLLH